MSGDREVVSLKSLKRRIALYNSHIRQQHESVRQYRLDHRRRQRLPHGRCERITCHINLLIISKARHRDGALNGCRICSCGDIGWAPEPKIVQVEVLDFGPRIQNCERGGPVDCLIFRCGDNAVV